MRTRIYLYNFILCVLVIFVHAGNLAPNAAALAAAASAPGAGLSLKLENLLSNVLGQFAVPGFFMLSGLLFFREELNGEALLGKLRRRAFSLLLPYLCWNALYYLLHLLLGDAGFGLRELAEGLLLYRYNPVFWYVFQLLLLTCLCPLFWLLLRRRVMALLFFGGILVLIYMQRQPGPLNADALLYYFAGAMLGSYDTEFCALPGQDAEARRRGRRRLYWTMLMAVMAYGNLYIAQERGQTGNMLLWLVILRQFCPLCLWLGLRLLPKQAESLLAEWMKPVFFVYATHYLLIRALARLLPDTLPETVSLVLYLCTPALCFLAGVFGLRLLQRFAPLLASVLTGGRTGAIDARE